MKVAQKGRREKGGPKQRGVQAHAPDRGRSAYVPGLGFWYGGSGQPQSNLSQTTGARFSRPLHQGL